MPGDPEKNEALPLVRLAALCDQVLREKDDTLSIIRVVDRFTLRASGPGAPEKMPPATFSPFYVTRSAVQVGPCKRGTIRKS